MLPKLRFLLDKTVKPTLPEEYCFLGYVDSQLVMCLELGLSMINSYQPYPTFANLDSFPIAAFDYILLKAALYAGVTSQLLFSIDTDVPSYSDQGHSFVLQHATPLASYLNSIKADLDKEIPNFKKHYLNNGTVGIEIGMNAAYYSLVASAPSGSIFRNRWFVT
jgi:hypothetical protein